MEFGAEVCCVFESAMHDDSSPRLNPFRTAPNLLTLLRICLAPFLVAAILEGRCALSFALFLAAGLTDALDGALARWLKQRSMLGQYLDPVADKLLLSTLFLVLMHEELIPTTVTVLVFGRDVGILLVAAHPLCGRGAAGVQAQHLRQGQHHRPGERGGRGAAAPAHRCALGGGLSHAGARCHHRADRGLGAALRVGRVAPGKHSGSQRLSPQSKSASMRARLSCVVGDVLGFSGFFNLHVAELFGVKDLATLQAFDKFGVFMPGDDSYLRVSAGGCHRSYYRLE